MAVGVFSVPVFLVVFRETLEAVIVISILLAFLKQTLGGPDGNKKVYNSLVRQVWIGAILGFLLCLVIGSAVIGTFYRVGRNIWNKTENIYEGVFYLIAAIIITIVGAALLRVGKMQEKWRVKLIKVLEVPEQAQSRKGLLKRLAGKYTLFFLSFITVGREGIEGVVFVSGVSFSASATSIPLPVVIGLIFGCFVGWILYRFGSTARLQVFLIASTCLLYLVAAGLVARSVSYFEQQHWNTLVGKDVGELGDGPGSYDIHRSVWHVDCCSPEFNGGGGWGIFNGILGWTNSATYSSVISYNIYWILVIASFLTMRYHEVRGHWPLMRPQNPSRVESNDVDSAQQGVATSIETDTVENGQVKEKAIIKENTTIVSVLQAISPN